uniref:BZIP domain-containing protein n=1 Tax=Steinernema glaseri TaxID=37863 RepID=A0A1I8AF63_9BILA
MYHQFADDQQLPYVNSPTDSDILGLEDWSLHQGKDFSLHSVLYNDAMTGSPSPVSAYTQPTSSNESYGYGTLQPKPEPTTFLSNAEPSPSFIEHFEDYSAPSPAVYAVEEKPLVAKHRKMASQRAVEDRDGVGPVRRRGRPMKATSNSKSALYAREYRMQNKKLLEEYRQQVEELSQKNRALEELQARMSQNYNRLQEELEEVQEVNRKLQSEIVPAVTQILQSGAQPTKLPLSSGVCIHLSQSGICLKSCDHCKGSSTSLPSPQSCRDPAASLLPFDGDFSFVERYLQC